MSLRGYILVVTVLVSLALSGPGAARGSGAAVTVTLRPGEDLSFPFWCDWAYDWEARCWWEDGDRLPVGGDVDKVWRAGLRFSLAGVPPDATILDASLTLRHDAVCLGPYRTTGACLARPYTIDLHPIFTAGWFSEREVEIGPPAARAALPLATRPDWVSWDVTGLVESWLAGEANHGVLLKVTDVDEGYDIGGPAFPSSAFARVAERPALEVVYVPSR